MTQLWARSAVNSSATGGVDLQDPAALPRRFDSPVVVSTPHPCDSLRARDAGEHGDRRQSCSGPADAAATCDLDALGRGASIGLYECGDGGVGGRWCAEVRPPYPSVFPREGSGITPQEVDAELGLGAVGQRVSQSATPDCAAIGELHDARTIGPKDHDGILGFGDFHHGRRRGLEARIVFAATEASHLDVPPTAGEGLDGCRRVAPSGALRCARRRPGRRQSWRARAVCGCCDGE